MNVLIADDEKIVLEGLKYIIDWKQARLYHLSDSMRRTGRF